MRHIDIVQTDSGQWLYTVYINGRITIVGSANSREAAEQEARLA